MTSTLDVNSAPPSAHHLSEDLLTPRFYTTETKKAARTNLSQQKQAFDAVMAEMKRTTTVVISIAKFRCSV